MRKKLFRTLSAVLALCMMIILTPIFSIAANTGDLLLSFDVSNTNLTPGDEATVIVSLANYSVSMPNIRGMGIDVSWDPGALEIVSGSPKTLLKTSSAMILTTVYNTSEQLVRFTYASGTFLERGNHTLFSFSVKAKATDTKTVKLNTTLKVSDPVGNFTIPVINAPNISINAKNPSLPPNKPGNPGETPIDAGDSKEITNPFKDVTKRDWSYDAVMYVYDQGLMIGLSDDRFGVDSTLTRAMIVTILYRNAGSPVVYGTNPFTDITVEWYKNAVQWAVSNGITNGVSKTLFKPNDPVTNEQLAALIYRTQQSAGQSPKNIQMGTKYPDWNKISNFARTAVETLTAQGVYQDIPRVNFNPQTPATRAEVASILYRYLTS